MDGGMLSQEEINALLSGMADSTSESEQNDVLDNSSEQDLLTATEQDALGELANISMGSAATALFSLLNQKVNITTPKVAYATWDDLLNSYGRPCVFVQIYYKEGIKGNNIFILKESDVKIITDLMMGGAGVDDGQPMSELHLSAISEAMNQMMGSAATSLSSMLDMRIDISPPISSLVNMNEEINKTELADFLSGNFVKVSFQLEVGNLINSDLMQLYPIGFAKELYKNFIKYAGIESDDITDSTENTAQATANTQMPNTQMPDMQMPNMQMPNMQMPDMQMPNMQMSNMQMSNMQMPNMQMPNMQMQNMQMPNGQQYPQYMVPPIQDVNISPVQFQPFTPNGSALFQSENIDLLLDVPLEVTAELGRTSKSIKEILDFAPGTIIELNRLAGEPIDVLVNGKFVAKGEVVLIDEAFGIKVTEIIK